MPNNMNAIELLKRDHRRVEEFFAQAESATSPTERKRLFKEICTELEIHMYAEEAVIYPYLSKEPGFEQLIEDAFDEHQEAKSLLQEIAATTSDNEIDNKISELNDAVAHHVKDEEAELFPKMEKHLTETQLNTLSDQLLIAKQNYAAGQAA